MMIAVGTMCPRSQKKLPFSYMFSEVQNTFHFLCFFTRIHSNAVQHRQVHVESGSCEPSGCSNWKSWEKKSLLSCKTMDTLKQGATRIRPSETDKLLHSLVQGTSYWTWQKHHYLWLLWICVYMIYKNMHTLMHTHIHGVILINLGKWNSSAPHSCGGRGCRMFMHWPLLSQEWDRSVLWHWDTLSHWGYPAQDLCQNLCVCMHEDMWDSSKKKVF